MTPHDLDKWELLLRTGASPYSPWTEEGRGAIRKFVAAEVTFVKLADLTDICRGFGYARPVDHGDAVNLLADWAIRDAHARHAEMRFLDLPLAIPDLSDTPKTPED